MMIHEITSQVPRYKPRKRIGRGEASGMGKTSGRGHKGAKSRAGWSARHQYDGGQINFVQKMPKRGFTNAPFRKEFHIVNLKALATLPSNVSEVSVETLAAAGIIRDAGMPLKILGEGEVTRAFKVTAAKMSASAKAKIEKAGGSVTEVVPTKWTRKGVVPDVKKPKPRIDHAAVAAEKAAAAKSSKEGAPKGKKDKSKDEASE